MKAVDVTALVESLARGQLGLVAARQLLAAGATRGDVDRLRRCGVLAPMRFGVYRTVGLEPGADHAVLAAVLACGDTAFASHVTAAALLGLSHPALVGVRAVPAPYDVTVVLERCPRPSDVRIHRSGRLLERDATTVRGVPCATAERVIVDISSHLSDLDLGLIIDSALRARLTTLTRIRSCSERLKRAPGRSPKRLAAALARRIPGAELTESPLEEFVYESIVRFGLPRPTPQHWVEVDGRKYRIDQCYPAQRYAIEAQSRMWHGFVSDAHPDALRGNDVAIAKFKLLQFTSDHTDWQIATTIARALGRPLPTRPGRVQTFAEWCRLHRV